MSRYDKERIIGSGTFGKVWLVKSKLSRHSYVLKEIKISSLNEDEQRQAYTEASALSKCKHKNIIRYKETVLAENKYLQIIMEYAEGGDLYTAILNQNGVPFSDHRIITWFIQICLALQYIHFKNILHRDLKSQNIFLTRSKTIKIGDFGIARILNGSDEFAKTAIGTPYYLSPEIFNRKPYNFKSDMWALGCVLFEMAALEHAFKAKDFLHLASLVLRGERRKLPTICNPIIETLVECLLRCNPDERPSTDEILGYAQLQPFLSEHLSHQSPRENLLPLLTGKFENGSRRASLDAFRVASLNLSKRRNSLTAAHPLSLKRVNPSSKDPVKSRTGLNNAFIKRCQKNTTKSAKEYDVSCKIKDKTFSVRLGNMDPNISVSSETYVVSPSPAEVNGVGARLTKSDDSLSSTNGYKNDSPKSSTNLCGRSISTGSCYEEANMTADKRTTKSETYCDSILKAIISYDDETFREAEENVFDEAGNESLFRSQISDTTLECSSISGAKDETYNPENYCKDEEELARKGSSNKKPADNQLETTSDSAFNTQSDRSDGSNFDKASSNTKKENDSLFSAESFNFGLVNSEDRSTPKSQYQITFDLPQDDEVPLKGASAVEEADIFSSSPNDCKDHLQSCISPDSPVHTHCSHTQCHQCMLDMLWKNRIRYRVDKAVDKDEYQRLKKQLLLVFKVGLFERVRHSLICDWDESEDATFKSKFKKIVKTLNYEQVQSLPLMMQLIQLDLLARNPRSK